MAERERWLFGLLLATGCAGAAFEPRAPSPASLPSRSARPASAPTGEKQRIEYRPAGAEATARGFVRLARVPDDRCVRR